MDSPAVASIHPYNHDQDKKLFLFYVAKQCMEPLAVANRAAMTSPWFLALWVALSSVFVNLFGWWPNPEHGYLGYLSPLPAFAAMAVPIMFFVDWRNRPYFDSQSLQVLQRPDIVNIQTHYARSPSSGIWMLDYGKNFVGLIALDASLDSQRNDPVSRNGKNTTSPKQGQKHGDDTAQVATIRHIYVYESYRSANAQKDLVQYAVDHAFKSNKTVNSIRATPSPYSTYIGKALLSEGFRVVGYGEAVGFLKRKSIVYEITRESWAATKSRNVNQSR